MHRSMFRSSNRRERLGGSESNKATHASHHNSKRGSKTANIGSGSNQPGGVSSAQNVNGSSYYSITTSAPAVAHHTATALAQAAAAPAAPTAGAYPTTTSSPGRVPSPPSTPLVAQNWSSHNLTSHVDRFVPGPLDSTDPSPAREYQRDSEFASGPAPWIIAGVVAGLVCLIGTTSFLFKHRQSPLLQRILAPCTYRRKRKKRTPLGISGPYYYHTDKPIHGEDTNSRAGVGGSNNHLGPYSPRRSHLTAVGVGGGDTRDPPGRGHGEWSSISLLLPEKTRSSSSEEAASSSPVSPRGSTAPQQQQQRRDTITTQEDIFPAEGRPTTPLPIYIPGIASTALASPGRLVSICVPPRSGSVVSRVEEPITGLSSARRPVSYGGGSTRSMSCGWESSRHASSAAASMAGTVGLDGSTISLLEELVPRPLDLARKGGGVGGDDSEARHGGENDDVDGDDDDDDDNGSAAEDMADYCDPVNRHTMGDVGYWGFSQPKTAWSRPSSSSTGGSPLGS